MSGGVIQKTYYFLLLHLSLVLWFYKMGIRHFCHLRKMFNKGEKQRAGGSPWHQCRNLSPRKSLGLAVMRRHPSVSRAGAFPGPVPVARVWCLSRERREQRSPALSLFPEQPWPCGESSWSLIEEFTWTGPALQRPEHPG